MNLCKDCKNIKAYWVDMSLSTCKIGIAKKKSNQMEVMNFITGKKTKEDGKFIAVFCQDINKDGSCLDFEPKLSIWGKLQRLLRGAK